MAKDPLHTKLCDLLGIEFPVIAFTHCKDVAVALINAGGFAVLGEAMHTPEDIAADIAWIRERVDGKKFGIDLVLPASVPPSGSVEQLMAEIPEAQSKFALAIKEKYDVPDPKGFVDLHQWGGLNQELARAQLDVLLDERVPVIASGLGSPVFILDAAHERDMLVFGLVGKARQAKRQFEAGVDAVIAQGYDAAGHTGAVGTFSIVPEVAAMAGDTPVIAAGGVTTGRHLAAALCLGASGVWSGTQWLVSRESDVDMIIKERLLAATVDDTSYSKSISGMTMRVLKCPWTEEWASPEAPDILPPPYQMLLSSDYLQGANDNRRADLMTEAAGQGVGLVTSMKPARQILFDMVEEALDTFEGLVGEIS
ncbi:MAG: putative monooxygenase [Acidimicrobiales bacterium]|nr:MAG: nitronate monooxygenase [Actinomycetota bacterium]MBV6509886.1 putative monooxygenase [Acidimicrobiales bacterium]RIK03296.1 MAG: monooxygenase [Acidobacteriota bacterium]